VSPAARPAAKDGYQLREAALLMSEPEWEYKMNDRPGDSTTPIPMSGRKRYSVEVVDGVALAPNACRVCRKWFPPYKAGVPSELADRYCWGHEGGGSPDE